MPKEKYSRGRYLRNWIKHVVSNPINILLAMCLVVLGYLMLVPLVEIIDTTFSVARGEATALKANIGDFTLFYWNRCLASRVSTSIFFDPLKNSLIVALCATVLSVIIGTLAAWLLIRSDIRLKRFFTLAIIIPYMLPSWCKAQAWISVFKVKSLAGVPGLLEAIGIPVPEWLAYGLVPMVCVLVMHYFAYAYLLVSAALTSVNSELEEMGEITGVSRFKILSKITFPLVLPSILSAFVLTFSKTIGSYTIGRYLGTPAQTNTIATMLRDFISSSKYQNCGYCLALILISISALMIFLNQMAIGKRKSYATIGGKGSRSTAIKLGKARTPITMLLFVFVVIMNMAPILVLFFQTFMLMPGTYSLSNFTVHFWIGASNPAIYEGEAGVLRNARFYMALWNTLKLTVLAATISTLVGQITGYLTSRLRAKLGGRVLEQLVFVPYLMPSIAFGAIYLTMFSVPRGIVPSLYGSFALLVLVSVVKNIPFASRAGASNMLQISTELEEAGQIQGIGFFKRFLRIILPLAKNGFMSGFMVIFIGVIKELDLIVLLAKPADYNLPLLAYQYGNAYHEPYANVIAVIMFIIVLTTYLISKKFFKVDLTGGMGG